MAIEFACPQCQHLLRTSEDKAGLSAKCPACGSPIWVPYAHEAGGPAPELAHSDAAHPAAPDAIDDEGVHLAPASDPVSESTDSGPAETGPAAAGDQDQRSEAAEVHCPNCAASNPSDSTRCRFCGTSLTGIRSTADPEWRPPQFDVSEIMSTAWRVYTQEIGLLIGCQLLVMLAGFVIAILLLAILGLPVLLAVAAIGEEGGLVAIPMGLIAVPMMFLLSAVLHVGQTRLYLKIARGQPGAVDDLMYGVRDGRRFVVPMMIIQLCFAGLGLLGTLLCCVPGILLGLCSWPLMPLLLDRDCSAGDAMGRTFEMVKENFGSVLAAGAIATGVLIAASIVPYLGVILSLFATPFALLFTTLAYLRLTRQKAAFD